MVVGVGGSAGVSGAGVLLGQDLGDDVVGHGDDASGFDGGVEAEVGAGVGAVGDGAFALVYPRWHGVEVDGQFGPRDPRIRAGGVDGDVDGGQGK